MSDTVSITTAFTLPSIEVEALIHGKSIVATSKAFVTSGRIFALHPLKSQTTANLNKSYHSKFILLEETNRDANHAKDWVRAWAKCESCQILDETTPVNILSKLTVWTEESLQTILLQQKRIFLLYLRVYELPKPVEISIRTRGQFTSLAQPLIGNFSLPVLGDVVFAQREKQLLNLELPAHIELEALQETIAPIAANNNSAKMLDEDLRVLLGWASTSPQKLSSSELDWINQIADTGNSSDGSGFEKLVRRSLVELGFTNSNPNPKASLDPEATGGAGGLDVCCREPYPLVGECKASKNQNVPTDVCSQLTYLGQTHFSDEYNNSIKVIFAAGPLTAPANQVAIGNAMNVIRPITLQRLLELKANYQGAIDLLALEPCLREAPFGEDADTKVNRYIDKVLQDLKLRSTLVQIVKQLTQPDKKQIEVVQICSAYNLTVFGLNNQSAWLDNQTVHELLIELSSPLAGYLGRLRTGSMNSDRFYYLRDLIVE